jgi:PAS domain-containing protein
VAETIIAWSGIIAASASALVVGWKICRRNFKLYRSLDRIHSEFGDHGFGALVDNIKAAELSLQQLHVRVQVSERLHGIGIYVCEPTGECNWTNDWLCQAFGIDSSKMLGWGWLAAIRKDEQMRVHDVWSTAVENGLPYREQYHVDAHNDSWLAETEAWPVRVDGELICYVGYVAPAPAQIEKDDDE